MRMKIIIAGAGEVGSHLAQKLSASKHQITVIDSNEDRLNLIKNQADVVTIPGLTTSINTLVSAGAEKADLFVAVNPATDQDVNLVSAMLAKQLGSQIVIARINNNEYFDKEKRYLFMNMGIDKLLYPERIASLRIVDQLKISGSSEFMNLLNTKLQLVVFKLDQDAPLVDKCFKDIPGNHYDTLYRPVAVTRDGVTIIPNRETVYQTGDIVFVICLKGSSEEAMALSGKHNMSIRNLMIMGGGRVGEMVARRMERHAEKIVIIEKNREVCERIKASLSKPLVINGDARDASLLQQEQLAEMDAFVAVTSSSEANILSCMAAKEAGVKKTIAQVENLDYIKLAGAVGIDSTINKKEITADSISAFTFSKNLLDIKHINGSEAEVMQFKVMRGSKVTLNKVKDLGFPKNAIIGGASRGDNQSFIVTGETLLKEHDRVVVIALPSAIEKLNSFFTSPSA